MKSTETVHFNPDSFNLVNLVFRHWKTLLITGSAAVIISAVISLTITPLFRSSVVLYPTANVVELQTLFGIKSTANELFGDETATEKVLQILKSDNIRNYLIKKYDLIKHYGISAKAKYKYTLLNIKMNKYIISRKTQYNSIEISVLDSDPGIASIMANDIARQVDTVFNQVVKDAGLKTSKAISNSYNEQFKRVKSLEDSLRLISPGRDVSVFVNNLKAGKSNSSWGGGSGVYSAEYLRLINMFESENENLSAIRSKLTEANMLAEQNLPYTHIINEAQVSEKKAQPKRSLIVLASTLSTLLLMIFLLGLADSVKRHD